MTVTHVREIAGTTEAGVVTMKAIAVFPGKPGSVHLAELPKPQVDEIPHGRGVLVKVLRVGVDGTDREINAAEYGAAPEGYPFLVIGHEGLGQVVEVGSGVTEVQRGDYVVATVRRPGSSLYDVIGTNDMTTDDTYFERGINLRHGYLTEYYVDDAEFIVKVPPGLKHVAVLLLRDIEELDTPEVAAMLGISGNAVKIRLHRARQALRTLLDPVFTAPSASHPSGVRAAI